MEQHTIQFGYGIHRSPSQSTQDGELSECVNLIPRNGELVNTPVATDIDSPVFQDGEKLIFIHHTSDGHTNYITRQDQHIVCHCSDNYNPSFNINDCKDIKAMGDIIILNTAIRVMYVIWNNKKYTLVSDIPNINLDFLLKVKPVSKLYVNGCTETDASITDLDKSQLIYVDDFVVSEDNEQGSYPDLEVGTEYLFTMDEHRRDAEYSIWFYGDPEDREQGEDLLGYVVVKYPDYQDTFTPERQIVRAEYICTDGQSVTFKIYKLPAYAKIIENTEENLTCLLSHMSTFNKEIIEDNKQFLHPFFARYGLEMYDGTIIHQSSPILITPNWGVVPVGNNYPPTDSFSGSVYFSAYAGDLYYRVRSDDGLVSSIESCRYILKNIVISITPQIMWCNEGAVHNTSYKSLNQYLQHTEQPYSIGMDKDGHDYIEKHTINLKPFLPSFSKEQYMNKLTEASNYYVIKKIPIKEIKTDEYLKIDLTDVPLKSIESMPTLSDEYNSFSKLSASNIFVYNNRLSLCCVNETTAVGNCACSPIYTDASVVQPIAYVYYNYNDTQCIRRVSGDISNIKWLYDTNQYSTKVVLYKVVSNKYYRSIIKLSKHSMLNGNYWIGMDGPEFEEISISEYNKEIEVANDITIPLPNYIYTSTVNNPFYFPPELQDTIGSGEIRTVTTSAKALSQGQFGQFPLYAFCSDGIWALSVASNGKYATTNPVSRDVVDNLASVCQIDSAVVFATAQGLKLLQGSETAVISDVLAGENTSESVFFAGADHQNLIVNDTESFVNMLNTDGTLVMCDYANMLIHVYPSDCATSGKHYVYSFANKEWSSVVDDDSKVVSLVHGYPYSTIQIGTALKQFQPLHDTDTLRNGILLTRPVSIDSPFAMKILADLRLFYRKTKSETKCKVTIYASNDQLNWHKVKSLRAHSWKWYRFCIQTSMTDNDALSAMTLLYDIRRTNKLR